MRNLKPSNPSSLNTVEHINANPILLHTDED